MWEKIDDTLDTGDTSGPSLSSVQELGDLMTQESNYHGIRVYPRIQSAIWKANPLPSFPTGR